MRRYSEAKIPPQAAQAEGLVDPETGLYNVPVSATALLARARRASAVL